jgi:hypothetical protein
MVLCCGKYSEIDYIPEILLTMPGTKKGGVGKTNMMDGIQENTTILGSPETQTEKLQSSLPAGFPKIFGRKQSTSKTVPRGALAIGLLRSSCLVGVCVCAFVFAI